MSRTAIKLEKPTAWTPKQVATAGELPADMAYPRFMHYHLPSGFVFDDALGFLPTLNELIAQPGVNGVDKNGNMNLAIGGTIQKGGILIDPMDTRLGPFKGYIGSTKCAGGRRRFGMVWDEFTILAGGAAKQKDTGAKKRALCAHLRDAGMVHTLEQPVYEELLDRENAQLERIALRATTNPHFNAAVETQKKRIAAMEAAWVKYAAEHFEAEEVEAEDASAELSALVKAQQAKPPKVDRKVTVTPATP